MNARTLLTGTTPGPWSDQWHQPEPCVVSLVGYTKIDGYNHPQEWAADIAQKDKDRALATAAPDLAARVIALEDGIRALHAKGKFIFSWHEGGWFEPACTECDGKAGVHPCGCYADDDESDWKCRECGPESTYPCPTIALLDKETK